MSDVGSVRTFCDPPLPGSHRCEILGSLSSSSSSSSDSPDSPSSYGDWGRMWWGKDAAQIKNIPQKSNKNDSHRLAGDLNNPPLKAIRHHLTSHRSQPITLLLSHTIKYHPIVSQLFCLLLHWPLVWKHLAKGYPLCSLCFWRLTPYTSSGSEHVRYVSTTSVQLWLSDSVWAPHHVTMSWNEALRQLSCRGAGPLEPRIESELHVAGLQLAVSNNFLHFSKPCHTMPMSTDVHWCPHC